jgi:hypothetical protein
MHTANFTTPARYPDRSKRICLEAALLLVLAIMSATAAAADPQGQAPQPPFPPGARTFDTGAEPIKASGLPIRISGFLSSQSPDELNRWYRQQLGQPVAESRLGKRQILGKESKGHYITVQLEPTDPGTRGVISVASMHDVERNQADDLAARERWLNRLPAGSRLLSLVTSNDGSSAVTHLVFINRHDDGLNQKDLQRLMREEGLELERASGTGAGKSRDHAQGRSGTTFYFKGSGREAVATVFPADDGQTAVVLNIDHKNGGGK